ncbi:MAG: branched-chain amino acid transport system II carrier protein [Clostridium sp.]
MCSSFSLRPGNITLWIGKIINPLFLFFLGILIVSALLHPGAPVSSTLPDASYQSGALFHALSEGYGTMDAIAGLAFGIVVVNVIRQMGVQDDAAIAGRGTALRDSCRYPDDIYLHADHSYGSPVTRTVYALRQRRYCPVPDLPATISDRPES